MDILSIITEENKINFYSKINLPNQTLLYDFELSIFNEWEIYKNDCWLWTAGKNKGGYGNFIVGMQNKEQKLESYIQFAHRVSWTLHNNQEIPDGMVVMHSCDNPSCVNPYHLSCGTRKENTNDSVKKLRHHHGENHNFTNLTTNHIRQIYDLLLIGKSYVEISSIFNISSVSIGHIAHGKNWKQEYNKLTNDEKNKIKENTNRKSRNLQVLPSSKLTKEQVLFIRSSNKTNLELADEFNVDRKTICNCKAKRTY